MIPREQIQPNEIQKPIKSNLYNERRSASPLRVRINDDENKTHLISTENLSSKTDPINSATEKKKRKKEVKEKKKFEKEQQKQLKKLNKKLRKQREEKSNAEKEELKSSPITTNVEVDEEINVNRIQKQKFATFATSSSSSSLPATASKTVETVIVQNESNDVTNVKEAKNATNIVDTTTNDEVDNNGNYDVLPLIKLQTETTISTEPHTEIQFNFTDNRNKDIHAVDVHAFSRTLSGSIPFIDQSPRHQIQPTIEAIQNITKTKNNENQQQTVITKHQHPTHVLYQSLKQSVDHHFESVDKLKHKLCQVCHEFIVVTDAIKCLTCGLICHRGCATQQVRINFILFLFL